MTAVSTAAIRQLRELTDAGLLDCKKALDEADGDTQRAVQILLAQGRRRAPERGQRSADNGAVAARVNDERTHGVLVELRAETDFVAKSERFVRTLDTIADTAAVKRPSDRDALLAAAVGPGTSVQDEIDALAAAVGENVVLSRYARIDGVQVTDYLHRTSPDLPPQVGVLVALDTTDADLAKDVAQHVAAMAPRYVSRSDVPAAKADERRGLVLREQAFVRDGSVSVGELLDRGAARVTGFARFRVDEP